MESMGKKEPRPRRSFTPEFKAEIVELCRRGDRTVGQIAKDFDLTETAVRLWVTQAEVDAGERDGLTSSEREESAVLRREKRRLREDVDILRRTTLDSTGQGNILGWCSESQALARTVVSFVAMASRSSWLKGDRFVPLGRYCRNNLLAFSLVPPRCQGLPGAAKNTSTPVSARRRLWAASSMPRSQVSVPRRQGSMRA